MLVLSRKRDEKIQLKVGDTQEIIEITVVRIEPNKVRLGIQAGENISILRSELVKEPNEEAR
jgi:carbon storage regulator